MAIVTITLKVSASALYNEEEITSKGELDKYCCLENGMIKPSGGSPLRDWTTPVKLGDKVTWRGEATDAPVGSPCSNTAQIVSPDNFKVKINSISYQFESNSTNIVEGDPMVIFDYGNSGMVRDTQLKSSGFEDGTLYYYSIEFTIEKMGPDGGQKTFYIDPKLEIQS